VETANVEESAEKVVNAAIKALEHLTGQKFDNYQQWKNWWRKNKKSFAFQQ